MEKCTDRTSLDFYFNLKLGFMLPPLILAILFTSACTKSPPPTVTDLIRVKAPTFSGLTVRSYTTPSLNFTLSGECDKQSKSLEYSLDGVSWTQFASGCSSGTFSTLVKLFAGLSHIYVRAKGKFSTSDTSVANVSFVLPPTSPTLEFVQSGAADQSDNKGLGVQSGMNLNNDGAVIVGPTNTVTISIPGFVYAP